MVDREELARTLDKGSKPENIRKILCEDARTDAMSSAALRCDI